MKKLNKENGAYNIYKELTVDTQSRPSPRYHNLVTFISNEMKAKIVMYSLNVESSINVDGSLCGPHATSSAKVQSTVKYGYSLPIEHKLTDFER